MGEPRPSFFNLSVVVIDLIDIDGAIEHDLRALKIKFYNLDRGHSIVTGEKFSRDSFLASFWPDFLATIFELTLVFKMFVSVLFMVPCRTGLCCVYRGSFSGIIGSIEGIHSIRSSWLR